MWVLLVFDSLTSGDLSLFPSPCAKFIWYIVAIGCCGFVSCFQCHCPVSKPLSEVSEAIILFVMFVKVAVHRDQTWKKFKLGWLREKYFGYIGWLIADLTQPAASFVQQWGDLC